MTYQFDVPIPGNFTAIIQGFDNLMTCKQFNDATIQADVLDTSKRFWYKQTFSIQLEVLASVWQLNNTIDVCYNDKMSEKGTMHIGKLIAKGILFKFNNFYFYY